MSVRTYSKEEKQAYLEDYKNSGETLCKRLIYFFIDGLYMIKIHKNW